MPTLIPTEFFLSSIAVIGALVAYVWNGLHVQVKTIKKEHDRCPWPSMHADIAMMKNDIVWIKDILTKEYK